MELQNDPPLVSVVVPMWNVEAFVEECVNSILRQTMESFELLLIDDASTDRTREICRPYESEDSRLRIICLTENQGLSQARNLGITKARGKYIAFIDSDDFVAPDYLAVLFRFAESENADVVSMGYTEYRMNPEQKKYVSGNELRTTKQPIRIPEDHRQRMEIMCDWHFISMAWGKIFRREFLLTHDLHFEPILSEDILFHFSVLYAANTYVLLPDTLYHYRVNPDSITRGKNVEKSKKSLRSTIIAQHYLDDYLSRMPEIGNDPVLVQKIRLFFLEAFFHYLYFSVVNGLLLQDVMKTADEVFSELMPEDHDFVLYLFQYYLKAKAANL